jgi:uncharacterized protein YecT (DUF1311 family)
MSTVCKISVAVILCSWLGNALADSPSGLPSETSCDANNNREYTECLGSVLSALGPILSRYYNAKQDALRKMAALEMTRFPAEIEGAIASLKRAQSEWQKYRDAHCDMVAREYLEGSGRAAGFAKCMIDLTRSRIRDLSPGTDLPEPR